MHERHSFLTSLLGVTKPEEDESYAIMMKMVTWIPVSIILFSGAEAGMFYAYNFEVGTQLSIFYFFYFHTCKSITSQYLTYYYYYLDMFVCKACSDCFSDCFSDCLL